MQCILDSTVIFSTIATGMRCCVGIATACAFGLGRREMEWPIPSHSPLDPVPAKRLNKSMINIFGGNRGPLIVGWERDDTAELSHVITMVLEIMSER